MSLILKVLSFKNKPVTETIEVSINNGGTIGRSDDNTLILPDAEKFVSRHHATIKTENGYYYLTDTSLGGITINGLEPPLHNATSRIDNGTLLKIGEYEVSVTIVDEEITDDFSFVTETPTQQSETFFQSDEQWSVPEDIGFNSLMTDNFPKHDELIQRNGNEHHAVFESGLHNNNSPLFDSYTAPDIISSPQMEKIPEISGFDDLFSEDNPVSEKVPTKSNSAPDIVSGSHVEEIPEGFNFDDLFSETDSHTNAQAYTVQETNKSEHDNFEDFLGSAISEIASNNEVTAAINNEHEHIESVDIFSSNEPTMEQIDPILTHPVESVKIPVADTLTSNELVKNKIHAEKSIQTFDDSLLFNKFLQGAGIGNDKIRPEQQGETMQRIGQMFRKLVDGTVAVLRSRAEFKSLCRVNMTVIRATDNNPLKFTVSTDDVLQQLLENKTDGFLGSVTAIEESFNDIMNHQLAMQAGIQASLTDLLRTFDPKIIEKQFEQGIVLQKKAKCWEKYEETYKNTVEDAVENFFGEEFVKAYEKQMNVLTNSRKKNN